MPIDENKEKIPNWPKIIFIFVIALFTFVLSNFIFARTTSDIREFMEDQNFPYINLEFFAIICFLITFYFLSGIFLSFLKRIFPKKISNSDTQYLCISVVFSVLFIVSILFVVFPALTTSIHGAEREGLKWIVFLWLLSISILNCLLVNSLFEAKCMKLIEMTGYSEKLDDLCERLSNRFK